MKAEQLTILALHWLRSQHHDAPLLCEMGLGGYSAGGRLDVAAITEHGIIAIEIKGDGDSPARLPLQAERYAAVCSGVWLLPSPSLMKGCERHRPLGWGMLEVIDGAVRQADRRCRPSSMQHRNAAGVLWEMLWADERRVAWKRLCVEYAGKLAISMSHCREGAELLPLRVVRQTVIDTLRARDWRNGGTYAKRSIWMPRDELPAIEDAEVAA